MIQRDKTASNTIALLMGLLFGLISNGSAWAHGSGPGLDYDPCAQRVGNDYVHMAAYQPQANWFHEYCGQIPDDGVTLFVFDLMGSEMRNTPVGVELVELGGRAGKISLVSIPSAEHVSGVINLSVPLHRGHSYQAVVTIGETPTSHTLTFPISVNAWWEGFEIPALLVLAVLWSSIYLSLRFRREHQTLLGKIEPTNRLRAVRT
jgi:hypothetical protein